MTSSKHHSTLAVCKQVTRSTCSCSRSSI